MLKIDDAPPLDADQATTVWPGDPAIRPGCDLVAWATTGAADALEVLPGQKAAAIVWRPLDEWEIPTLPAIRDSSLQLHCIEAARMGLVSIEGVKLARRHERGSVAGRIPMEQMLSLRRWVAVIPYGLTVDAALVAEFGLDPNLETRGQVGEMSFPEWMGALILAHSFPRR